MVIRSIRNQYRGINAHLHSYWQSQPGWPEFHTGYLLNLLYALKPLLLTRGYTVELEPSLQIRRLDGVGGSEYPESDLTIFDLRPERRPMPQPFPGQTHAGELTLPIRESIFLEPQSEKTYQALRIDDARTKRGEPLVWIEVLSPSNKPGGRDARQYFAKREKIVETGIVFVEIDYLHESDSTILRLESPTTDSPHPYHVLIVDPRPTLNDGVARVIGFDVDEVIPTPEIALNGDDRLTLPLDLPYHTTLQHALYGLERVDYAVLPLRFERYREHDQARILNRVLAVLQAWKAGLDLESGPFPALERPYAEAMELWQQMQTKAP